MPPITRRTWDALLLLALLAGGALVLAARDTGVPAAAPAAPITAALEPAPLVGHPAPDFALDTPDGTRVVLSELRGQVALINVWATWCPPCRAEMPAIQAAFEQYRDQGFTVLAINMQERPEYVTAFMAERGLTFPTPLDADGRVSVAYQARVVPSSFFVDRRGVVRAVYRGPLPHSAIAGTLEQLLAEAP
jgi:peroxiredoxin